MQQGKENVVKMRGRNGVESCLGSRTKKTNGNLVKVGCEKKGEGEVWEEVSVIVKGRGKSWFLAEGSRVTAGDEFGEQRR